MNTDRLLSTHVRIVEGVVCRDLDGEMVLLNLNSGIYFGLDAVGTQVWHLLQSQSSVGDVVKALLEEYEVAAARCEQDVMDLVSRLLDKGLLQINDDLVA